LGVLANSIFRVLRWTQYKWSGRGDGVFFDAFPLSQAMLMMGGLAEATGFSAHEIENMDASTLTFWWNCIMSYRAEIKKQME